MGEGEGRDEAREQKPEDDKDDSENDHDVYLVSAWSGSHTPIGRRSNALRTAASAPGITISPILNSPILKRFQEPSSTHGDEPVAVDFLVCWGLRRVGAGTGRSWAEDELCNGCRVDRRRHAEGVVGKREPEHLLPRRADLLDHRAADVGQAVALE